jgi:hypothetical protein
MKPDWGFWIWVAVSYAIGIACIVYLMRRVRRGEYVPPMLPLPTGTGAGGGGWVGVGGDGLWYYGCPEAGN